jgi:hypothetical protein
MKEKPIDTPDGNPVAWVYTLHEGCGPTFTANADDPFVKAGRATPLFARSEMSARVEGGVPVLGNERVDAVQPNDKRRSSWRDQVEGAVWDADHSGHYILARDMAAILDRMDSSATHAQLPHLLAVLRRARRYIENRGSFVPQIEMLRQIDQQLEVFTGAETDSEAKNG